MDAHEGPCGCPLEVRYKEALERIANPGYANARVTELVTIAREALARSKP